jgi:hypothetical protein
MTLDGFNKWLGPLANIGILGGLVMVALQMNQNTAALRLQNALELNRGIAAGEIAFMGDSTHVAYATALFNPSELTDAQAGQLWAYFNTEMFSIQNQWLAHQVGSASEEDWVYAQAYATGFLGLRAARIWWDNAKWTFRPDFVKAIDAGLAVSDPLAVEHDMRRILEDIRSLERGKPVEDATKPSEKDP